MTRVSESIDVSASVERIFPLFLDLDTLPRMLTFIERVEPLSPTVNRWFVKVAGQSMSVDTTLVAQTPNQALRWEGEANGRPFIVTATTQALDAVHTRVGLDAEFNVGGMAEKLGLAKPIAAKAMRDELANAKRYVERRFLDV